MEFALWCLLSYPNLTFPIDIKIYYATNQVHASSQQFGLILLFIFPLTYSIQCHPLHQEQLAVVSMFLAKIPNPPREKMQTPNSNLSNACNNSFQAVLISQNLVQHTFLQLFMRYINLNIKHPKYLRNLSYS